MGDRANVIVQQETWNPDYPRTPVWLYTHWGGQTLARLVRDVLARHARWDDTAYLTRIIFSQMISTQVDDDTGYGISGYPCDNEYDYIILDTSRKLVGIYKMGYGNDPEYYFFDTYDVTSGPHWTYSQFSTLTDDELSNIYH